MRGQVCPRCQRSSDTSPSYGTGGLQIGGGMTVTNAQEWLDAGASKVSAALGSDSWLNLFRLLSLHISFLERNSPKRDLETSPEPSERTSLL